MRVDLSKIIKDKNPKLYHYLPEFLITLLKKIVHQEDVNELLRLFGHMEGVAFITASLDFLNIERNVDGLENLDKNGRFIIASNHPLGGLDAFIIAEALERRFGSVKIVVNDILMNLTPLIPIFTPVNKHGRQTPEYVKMINDMCESDTPILYFPAGLCSRKINGTVTDLKWRKNFIVKALEYNRDIVPTYVHKENSPFFYNFALMRKKLGIAANLEMMLLTPELFKMRDAKIDITFGKATSITKVKESGQSAMQWCETFREECYDLKNRDTK